MNDDILLLPPTRVETAIDRILAENLTRDTLQDRVDLWAPIAASLLQYHYIHEHGSIVNSYEDHCNLHACVQGYLESRDPCSINYLLRRINAMTYEKLKNDIWQKVMEEKRLREEEIASQYEQEEYEDSVQHWEEYEDIYNEYAN